MMLIDGARAVVGSLALTALSLDFRREVALVVDEPAAVAETRSAVSFYRRGGGRDGHRAGRRRRRRFVLIALLLALTLDPPASDPADTRRRPPRPTPSRPRRSRTRPADTSQGVPLVLPKAVPDGPSRRKALRFVWRDHPSLRAGRNFRLDFAAKLQDDARDPGDDPTDFPTWELHRLRVGVEGEVFRQDSVQRRARVLGERSTTIRRKKSTQEPVEGRLRRSEHGDRDADPRRQVQDPVRPRSDERRNQSRFHLPLARRQLPRRRAATSAAMVHGRFFNRGLNYWVGGFQHDGDNSRSRKIDRTRRSDRRRGRRHGAGRVTALVFRKFGPTFLKGAEIGGSYAPGQRVRRMAFCRTVFAAAPSCRSSRFSNRCS